MKIHILKAFLHGDQVIFQLFAGQIWSKMQDNAGKINIFSEKVRTMRNIKVTYKFLIVFSFHGEIYTYFFHLHMIFIPFSRKTKARVLSPNGVMMPSTYIAHIQANLGH